jgi:hypothetical protein
LSESYMKRELSSTHKHIIYMRHGAKEELLSTES